jgi:hypothetical protein
LGPADQPVVEQLAAAVGLADAVMRYAGAEIDDVFPERTNGRVALAATLVDAWPLEAPTRRAERAFGLNLELGAASSAT